MEGSDSVDGMIRFPFWKNHSDYKVEDTGRDQNEYGQTLQQMNAVVLVTDGANLKQSNVGGHGAKQVDVSNNGEVKSPGLSDRTMERKD